MKQKEKLRILLVDDEEIVQETIGDYLEQLGHLTEIAWDGKSAIEKVDTGDFDLSLVDIRMPGMDGFELLGRLREMRPDLSVVMVTGHGTMDTAIQALRAGADDFLTKPVKLRELDAVLEKTRKILALRHDKQRLAGTVKYMRNFDSGRMWEICRAIAGNSPATQQVRREIEMAVSAGCETILITGETGTGKEVVARQIHETADPDSPFIAVSCPALPDALVESELFGHTKGSFTGATEERMGCFELADGGTLFLDEIADLSQPAQAKILRALETRSVKKVGGTRESEVDVRVIAATNVELADAVETGQFRRDLYYRLNVFSICISPLRERLEDVPALAECFLGEFGSRRKMAFDGFSDQALALLSSYDYPGNCRELRNIVERAAVLKGFGRIDAEHIIFPTRSTRSSTPSPGQTDTVQEERRIVDALERARWNRREAARLLGIPYSTLRYRMKKLGVG